jgi:CPA1 family monovalent cation:H+ antiporter
MLTRAENLGRRLVPVGTRHPGKKRPPAREMDSRGGRGPPARGNGTRLRCRGKHRVCQERGPPTRRTHGVVRDFRGWLHYRPLMSPETTLVLLFTAATAVAIATRLVKVPYTVALVLAGVGLGATQLVPGLHLTKDLLYAVFLPGLLFEASYHLELAEFRANARAILALAIPGVLVAIGATATLLVLSAQVTAAAVGFGWPHALVFAALIAATDPIAVVGLFKTLGAPKRLRVLVEGESLVNDGTSIVLFMIVYAAVTGGQMSVADGVLAFVKVVGMGLVLGATIGIVVSKVIQRIDDPMIEISLTTLAAYGSFIAAEGMHFSGVIATVTAGMVCGNVAAPRGMSPSTRIAVESFWEYLAFALNSLIFLLIGLEVPLARMLAAWRFIGIAFFAVTVGRALVVALASAALHPTRERIPWRWAPVLTWGGLRGALSMVLALGLPLEFPHRDLIVTMTFGVVVVSIVVQGVTMGPLLRALKLVRPTKGARLFAERAELLGVRAALDALRDLERDCLVPGAVASEVREEYEQRAEGLEADVGRQYGNDEGLHDDEIRFVRRHLLGAEKDAILEAHRRGLIDDRARDRHRTEIDERVERTAT